MNDYFYISPWKYGTLWGKARLNLLRLHGQIKSIQQAVNISTIYVVRVHHAEHVPEVKQLFKESEILNL